MEVLAHVFRKTPREMLQGLRGYQYEAETKAETVAADPALAVLAWLATEAREMCPKGDHTHTVCGSYRAYKEAKAEAKAKERGRRSEGSCWICELGPDRTGTERRKRRTGQSDHAWGACERYRTYRGRYSCWFCAITDPHWRLRTGVHRPRWECTCGYHPQWRSQVSKSTFSGPRRRASSTGPAKHDSTPGGAGTQGGPAARGPSHLAPKDAPKYAPKDTSKDTPKHTPKTPLSPSPPSVLWVMDLKVQAALRCACPRLSTSFPTRAWNLFLNWRPNE